MTEKHLTDYRDLPPDVVKHLSALEDLIVDLDGKTLCTNGPSEGDQQTFHDEGTIVSDDYVEHFNGIAIAVRAALKNGERT